MNFNHKQKVLAPYKYDNEGYFGSNFDQSNWKYPHCLTMIMRAILGEILTKFNQEQKVPAPFKDDNEGYFRSNLGQF